MRQASKFAPTKHAAQRLRERAFPTISEPQAFRLLERYARQAQPLKVVTR